jgi:hypothetical protein
MARTLPVKAMCWRAGVPDAEGSVYLPIEAESRGTIAYLALFTPIAMALSRGGTVLIDELDSSLHTNLEKQIVSAFNSRELNPKKGQLLFRLGGETGRVRGSLAVTASCPDWLNPHLTNRG